MKESRTDGLKVVIVDDMTASIDCLSRLLKQYKDIEVVATAKSAKEGLKKILLHEPDIIFLDVELPDEDGFKLINNFRSADYNPIVNIVTTDERHALKAIKHESFDYLLKPVNKLELDLTINRIRAMNKINQQGLLENLLMRMTTPRVLLNTKNDSIMIDPREVMYCEANGNYCSIHMDKDKKEFISYNLGKVFDIFSKYNFIRIERSFIINKDFLDRVNRTKRICTLKKNSTTVELKISRGYMQSFSNMTSF
jgi:two-component system, LytTR family, response regulator